MDERAEHIQSPNFWFLAQHDELLLKCAAQAELLVFADPNAALFKVRLFGELLAKQVAVRSGIPILEAKVKGGPLAGDVAHSAAP